MHHTTRKPEVSKFLKSEQRDRSMQYMDIEYSSYKSYKQWGNNEMRDKYSAHGHLKMLLESYEKFSVFCVEMLW